MNFLKKIINNKSVGSCSFIKNSRFSRNDKMAGFSLLEMLMVLAIFGILTSITIFNYGNFNSNILMTNLAYEVALSIREAQVFSLGVRGSAFIDEGDSFDTNYGVYFDIENHPDKFTLFVDGDDNFQCTDCIIESCISTEGSECLSTKSMTRGVEIEKICISNSFDAYDFINDITACNGKEVDEMTIIFERPSPKPFITDIEEPSDSGYDNAAIVIKTPNGSKRAVIVRETGQISVEFISNE